MFEQCSADISTILPSFDSSARDAFMASHRAESNNTGSISESGYRDEADIAATVALARPLLDNPNLDSFISDSTQDDRLIRCSILANLLS
jgi:hypothetical protein